jgi:pyruvate kinase
MRRAKIVCTLGPASSSPERIGELIDAGMDVARLNFSHADRKQHEETARVIRTEADRRGRAVAILLDLQGPKIRVGRFRQGSVELKRGNSFTITTDIAVEGDATKVSTTYEGLPRDVKKGDQIMLDDGYLQLEVTEVHASSVVTRVVHGGILRNNKGINLPHVDVSAPTLTDKDRHDLAYGVRIGVEYIALSFVRSADDVRMARELATVDDYRVPIIAKIERPQAIDRLDEIVEASDGIMVARGDLGVELGPEKVPLLQKRIIETTNRKGKLVITATQMLESMMTNSRPSRAEASDVANAVLDGTDALMLSGETAVGAFPVETVRTMSRIISEIEESAYYRHRLDTPVLDLPVSANAVAHAAVIAAQQMNLATIAVVSESGGAARLMSEYRPAARILALTTNEITYRRLALYWGVTPILVSPTATTDEMIGRVEAVLRERHLAEPGEHVVLTMGVPVGSGESTNLLKIHRMT